MLLQTSSSSSRNAAGSWKAGGGSCLAALELGGLGGAAAVQKCLAKMKRSSSTSCCTLPQEKTLLLNSELNVLQSSEGTRASRRDRSVVRVVMLQCRHGFEMLAALHSRRLHRESLLYSVVVVRGWVIDFRNVLLVTTALSLHALHLPCIQLTTRSNSLLEAGARQGRDFRMGE